MATTGISSSGTDFIGLYDSLKEVYDKPFENNIEGETEVWSALSKAEGFEVTDLGGDGRGIIIDHTFSYGGGVYMMGESDYFGGSGTPTTVRSTTTVPTLAAVAQMSGRVMRRMKGDQVAFSNWADNLLPKRAKRAAFHLDRQALGTGTGIIGRISGTPDATDDGITAAFGVSGLAGAAKLILRDDRLRYSPNANGSSPRTGVAVVSNKPNIPNSTFSTAALPTSAAANDYIFLGDTQLVSAAKDIMGLEGIIDDGTNVATIQGLARSTYAELNAQIVDASSGTFGAVLSEDLIDYADSLAYENGDGGEPNLLMASRSGNRSFWKSLKADRLISNPDGKFTGGRSKLTMLVGDRVVNIVPCRKCPDSRAYGVDTRAVKRVELGAGGWVNTTGSVFKQVSDSTGYLDAYVAHYVKEVQIITYDPAMNYKLTNLASA
jgi:hypothetical protein